MYFHTTILRTFLNACYLNMKLKTYNSCIQASHSIKKKGIKNYANLNFLKSTTKKGSQLIYFFSKPTYKGKTMRENFKVF